MTRRTFTLLLAWLWPWSREAERAPWDLSDDPQYECRNGVWSRKRPWSKRADELFEKQGHWADLCAFEEWFQRQEDEKFDGDSCILETLKNGHGLDVITLYCICCDLADTPTPARTP